MDKFALTGMGQHWARKDVVAIITAAGGSIQSKVGPTTTVLLTGKKGKSSGTQKHRDADRWVVPKMDVDEFADLVQGPGGWAAARREIGRLTTGSGTATPPGAQQPRKRVRRKLVRARDINAGAGDGLIDF